MFAFLSLGYPSICLQTVMLWQGEEGWLVLYWAGMGGVGAVLSGIQDSGLAFGGGLPPEV